jgi:hypothetical protein
MNKETCKALLESGVLQAFADGKEIEFWNSVVKEWQTVIQSTFISPPEQYRVKPKPKYCPGDFVRVKGFAGVYKVMSRRKDDYYICQNVYTGVDLYEFDKTLTPVRQVLTPHTFETALKAVAEKGDKLLANRSVGIIVALNKNYIQIVPEGEPPSFGLDFSYAEAQKFQFASDNSPFAQVTYEDII